MSTAELKEIVAELARSTGEMRKSQEKSQEELRESQKESGVFYEELRELQKETALQMRETDRKIKELSELFTGQWGKLVEALVDSGLPALFQTRGIAVRTVARRQTYHNGREKIAEIDVMLRDGCEDIGVEVKTTCRVADVDEHLERLNRVRAVVVEYETGKTKLYGGIAALKYEAESDRYARRKGLFVLECRDGIFTITNEEGFQPKDR